MSQERLEKQIAFILEIDRLKHIMRQSYVTGGTRKENSAEHSWHLAVMAMVLVEHSNIKVDLARIMKMVLIHDLVEIDAGDTFVYDEKANAAKAGRELQAANRIFGLVPGDQCREFKSLWEEFEAQQTPEAKFAAAIDRLMPLMHNYVSQGRTWQEHDVRKDMVIERNRHIQDGSKELWNLARRLIEDAVNKGYLTE